MEVANVSLEISNLYKDLIEFFPSPFGDFFNLLAIVLLVSLYGLFIWKFYRFIAKKDIISLNLNQYNRSSNPAIAKFLAGIFYFLEYIIIMPFMIFFWFAFFTLFIVLLNETLTLSQILIVSAVIISAVRMTAYYKEDLSKDLAKLLPFTLLAVSLLNPNFFNIERIITHLLSITDFFSEIKIYLLFIVFLEIILRFFSFIFSLFGIEEEEVVQE